MAICTRCRRASRLHSYYDEGLCPACQPGEFRISDAVAGILYVSVPLAMIGMSSCDRRLGLYLLPMLCVLHGLLVIVHEGAHAIAAKLVGWQVHYVALGAGRPRRSFHVGRLLVLLAGRPWRGGSCALAPKDDAPRLAAAGVIAAAPMCVHLAAAMVTVPWAGLDSLAALVVSIFVSQNVLFFLSAGWPREVSLAGRTGLTDGGLLREVLQDPEAARKRWRGAGRVNPILARIVARRPEDAFAAAQESATRYPDDPEVLALLCGAAVGVRRWDVVMLHLAAVARTAEESRPREQRALSDRELAGRGLLRGDELEDYFRTGCLSALERLDESISLSEQRLGAATTEEARALWSSDLAIGLLQRGAEGDLDRAEDLARFAYERLPWVPVVEVAIGMARIDGGDAKVGRGFLKAAARGDADGATAELRAAWGIAADAAEGRVDRARKLFADTKVWSVPANRRRAERALSR